MRAIGVAVAKLNFFNAATTAELLCRPAKLIGLEVAAQVYARTGGQPHLVQMYGSKLITLLSKAPGGRRAAKPDDVATVEPQVLEASGYYFSDAYEKTPADVKPSLEALARGETAELPPYARRWLTRRNLLTPENTLAVPVLGAWIVDQLTYGRAARAGD